MENLLLVFIVLYCIQLFIIILAFFVESDLKNMWSTKKVFVLSFIPFYYIYSAVKKMRKKFKEDFK
jgi:hypothetical protein